MAKPKARKRISSRDLRVLRGGAASVRGGVAKKQFGGSQDKRGPGPTPTPAPAPTPTPS